MNVHALLPVGALMINLCSRDFIIEMHYNFKVFINMESLRYETSICIGLLCFIGSLLVFT